MKLLVQWNTRLKLRAKANRCRIKADKVWAEADKLHIEGNKVWAEEDRLRAKSDKLRAKADKLRAEGNKIWAEAILETFGNITLEWKWHGDFLDCELENGEVYTSMEMARRPSRSRT